MIDFFAKERHFVDHLAPVWRALEGDRGTFYAPGDEAHTRALELGIDAVKGVANGPDVKTVAASIGDLKSARSCGRRVALMEHGCGLSYGGDRLAGRNHSYAGGEGRPAEVFLHPGEHPAARDRARYPEARVEVVGSPRLDTLPYRASDISAKPVLVVSFHWDCAVCAETNSAFIEYRSMIPGLQRDFEVLGHGHPRIMDRLAPWYERHGIEPVRDFDEVCSRADLYAVDNSSTLYEFASTGRPVLVINSRHYRKAVNHGLRFWEASTVGVQVDDPRDLADRALMALEEPWEPLREAALDKVYAYRSGAAERAAEVLRSWE